MVGKIGYSGVFKCALDVDEMFKAAEPPTHDDWVYRFVHDPRWRSFVKIALRTDSNGLPERGRLRCFAEDSARSRRHSFGRVR